MARKKYNSAETKKIVFTETFQNIGSFVNAITNRENNKVFKTPASNLTDSYMQEFTGTKNFEEALDLFQKGDIESYNKIEQVSNSIKIKSNDESYKKTIQKNICGFAPNVPLYITGSTPKNMYNIVQQKVKSNILNIVLNCSVSSYSTSSNLASAGAKFLSVISELEKRNYRINLYAMMSCYSENDIIEVKIKLKNDGSPLNRLRCAFPIVNPSFLRRILFKWVETIPAKINKGFSINYGRVNRNYIPEKNEKYIMLQNVIEKNLSIDEIITELTK